MQAIRVSDRNCAMLEVLLLIFGTLKCVFVFCSTHNTTTSMAGVCHQAAGLTFLGVRGSVGFGGVGSGRYIQQDYTYGACGV